MTLVDLVPTLQLAVGPVILISGIGLILLSMTNRFGRLIDRSRILAREHQKAEGTEKDLLLAQLRILSTRARITRAAIALASISVLLAALLIIGLFLGSLIRMSEVAILITLFVLCLSSLIASLILFIWDINLSLKALWLEMPKESRD
jgi:hypothetical protein